MSDARARNIGWRIDYVLLSAALRPRLTSAFIRNQVPDSDHCPVGIDLAPPPPPAPPSEEKEQPPLPSNYGPIVKRRPLTGLI